MRKSQVVSLLILIFTLIFVIFIKLRPEPKVIKAKLEDLPYIIGEFVGYDVSFDIDVHRILKEDAYISRVYKSKRFNFPIFLYIGYYGTKKGGRPTHLPEACYPGAGWGIVDIKFIKIKDGEKEYKIKKLLLQKGGELKLVLYWLQNEREIIPTGIKLNLIKFYNRLVYNRADGAFVRVSANVENKENIKKILEVMKLFSKELLRILPNYWPTEDVG